MPPVRRSCSQCSVSRPPLQSPIAAFVSCKRISSTANPGMSCTQPLVYVLRCARCSRGFKLLTRDVDPWSAGEAPISLAGLLDNLLLPIYSIRAENSPRAGYLPTWRMRQQAAAAASTCPGIIWILLTRRNLATTTDSECSPQGDKC